MQAAGTPDPSLQDFNLEILHGQVFLPMQQKN
jgi:hypothetical protein